MTGRRVLALLLLTAFAVADDGKPLPVRRSVILPSGGTYFVEGRKKIRWGQELSVQKGTRIVGRGEDAVLVVAGALQVRGIDGSPVVIEGLVLEAAERCERIHLETVNMIGGGIRTPPQKTCEAHIHLEEVELRDAPVDLRLAKGQVTILSGRTVAPVSILGIPKEGKSRALVKSLINGCNIDREFHAQGIQSLVVRGNAFFGRTVTFLDNAVLTFDANIIKGPGVTIEQSKPGQFKKTKVQKTDFHGKLVLIAPRDGKKKDKIPVDKCWFNGRTKKDEILKTDISDGHTNTKSGAYVVFRKINKRELKLGGLTKKMSGGSR